jgi:biotin carboxyl carrier protein
MKVTVNDKFSHELEINEQEITIDKKIIDFDYFLIKSRHSNVVYNHKSFNVELIEENRVDKTFALKVNGTIYHVQIKDKYDELLQQLGFENAQAGKVAQLKAPMPGLVLKILVEQDQVVSKGENLLILEAMKMENMIKSPADGTIKRLLVTTGDKIEKNTILIEFN